MSFDQPTATVNLIHKLENKVVYNTKMSSLVGGGLDSLSYAFA